MKYQEGSEQLRAYRRQIAETRRKMRETQTQTEPQEVSDYEFQGLEATVRLSGLFGKYDDLMVVHNMGQSCPACTLWADGYNGLHQHVASRTGFVVSSPDSPEAQKRFASSRGWVFPMVSHQGNTFAADMGYTTEKGWRPGISVFKRQGSKILRVSDAEWAPGDDFCTVWHLFDLLPEGSDGWRPKLKY